jgi:hypothetical protein
MARAEVRTKGGRFSLTPDQSCRLAPQPLEASGDL